MRVLRVPVPMRLQRPRRVLSPETLIHRVPTTDNTAGLVLREEIVLIPAVVIERIHEVRRIGRVERGQPKR